MTRYIRPMRKADIPQVTEVDREAFFGQWWPAANYYQELRNRLAHYIAAYDNEERNDGDEARGNSHKNPSGLAFRLKSLFNRSRLEGEMAAAEAQFILGFAGFWIMADEAHITSIAIRGKYRRQGIGELLLLSLIDMATELNTGLVTLEVRASNIPAQKLYAKCGFVQVGVRRGYYTDNKEDGVLMSLEDISSARVRADLERLKQAHIRRWGSAIYQLAGEI